MVDRCGFIVVVGCMRSGTSLLRTLLDSHPDIAIPPESDLARRLIRGTDRLSKPVDEFALIREAIAGSSYLDSWDVPRDALLDCLEHPSPVQRYIEGYLRVHAAYAHEHGATLGGDKTPINVHYVWELSRLLPEARFIHIVRDGRDVVSSIVRSGLGPNNAVRAAQIWNRAVGDGRAAGERLPAERYREIRYEDLVADPRATAQQVCEFLGVEFDPQMLRTTESGRSYAAASQAPHLARLAEPIAPRARSWADDVPVWSRSGALEEMRPTLRALGYLDGDDEVSASALGRLDRRAQHVYLGSVAAASHVAKWVGLKLDMQVKGRSGHLL